MKHWTACILMLLLLACQADAKLTLIGSYKIPVGNSYDMQIDGSYAYVACGNAGLRIINVSDPSSPADVGHYNPSNFEARGVAIAGNYAYVVGSDRNFPMEMYSSLRIIDVSNPTSAP